MDHYLPFFLANTANSTTATTSKPSSSAEPQIRGMLRDTKGQVSLALNLPGGCYPGILEQ